MGRKLIAGVILILIWETLASFKEPIPSLLRITQAFIEDFSTIMNHSLSSILIILLAFMIMLILLSIMLLTSKIRLFRTLYEVLNTLLHPIPGVALLIVVITVFGLGLNGLIFIMIHSMLWPIYTSVAMEEKRLKKDYERIIKTFKLPAKKVIFSVYIPGMMPGFLSGMKVAWSRGWRAFISAEMIMGLTSNISGMGQYLYQNRLFMNIPGQFAGLVMISIISFIVEYGLFNYIEKRTIRKWAI